MGWFELAALLASAALSYYQQDQSIKKQENAANDAAARQNMLNNEATKQVTKKANEFDANNRLESQNELAQQLTDQYQGQVQAQPITAQGVQVGATVPKGQETADYAIARAKETAKALDSSRKLAALMGRTGAATQMRQNEAIGLGDLSGDLGRLQTNSDRLWGVDQAGIAAAGQPNLAASIGGAALKAYGLSGGLRSGNAAKPATAGQYKADWLGSSGSWLGE